MNIIPGSRTRRELQALRNDFDLLRGENKDLREVNELQALVIDDITTAQKSGNKYRGNIYQEYLTTIQEVAKKYEGTAEWGVQLTGNIIDVRAAFIIGQGVAVIPSEKQYKDSEEMKFVKAFFDYNDLDREMAQEFAKEAEIEGCFLGQLFWEETDQMVSIRFQSRVDRAYTIITDPKDYASYQKATWKEPNATVDTVLEESNFVYARFGGRVHLPNCPIPKIGKCLTQIESIDRALRDWREINNLFAAPITTIECQDDRAAAAMAERVKSINWKLRRVNVIVGKFTISSPSMEGVASLENEILTNAKMTSGTTGCPIGFMGLGELTTKLGAGSEITSDLITAGTSKERATWIGKYTEVISKAMKVRNANSALTALEPSRVKVVIPFITAEAWKRVTETYLPLYTADAIDLATLLAQVPNVDADAEMDKAAERQAKALEKFTEQNKDKEDPDEGIPDPNKG